ncbi:unnamed protein product [Euphydryas editha]|uniref:WD and tetratricopeptide repeats protein 1 n=1 Tax=Euphydryas editha TaxID=104508 RepID=A0AAU9TI20_EUPED|nr:unnamed protein product [Euphydryas editha]
MGGKEELTWAHGTVGLTVARERGEINRKFQNKLTVTRSMIDRLGLEKELNGHLGCVNCLEWNSDGSVLASASDDLHVILWDPYRHKQIHTLSTGHTGNIFSVKFLSPESLVTCAADGSVRARNIMNGQMLLECACHCGRVKRLAVAPDNPQILWSAGEDGLVLQHDLRCPHRCNSDSDNVLVNLLNHMGRYAEAKCLAVNPRRPYQLAVGANDVYVRLYDIRMIKLARLQELQGGAPNSRLMWERQNVRCSHAGHGDPDNNIPREAVQYFAPGHLSMQPNANSFPKKAVTYLAYSHDGNELLVNMGSEQVYLFDINTASRPMLLESFIIQHNQRCREVETRQPHEVNSPVELPPLPEEILRLKESANLMMNKGNYANAIEIYSRAIAEWPWSALLYSNRAASLLRRSCRVAVERLALLQPRRLALAPQLVSVCSVELYRELYDRAIAEWPWSALLYSNRAASLLRRSCRVAVERLALLQPRRLALAPQLVSVSSVELYRELYDRAIAEWPWSALLYSNRAASLLRRSCRVAVERLALLQPRRLALAPQLVSVCSVELYRELYDRAIAEWPWSALLYSNRAASLLRRSCRVAVERLALLQPRRLALAPQLVSVCSVELYRELYDRAIAEWPWSALLYSNRAASLLRRSCRVAVERLALLQPRRLALAPQLVSVSSVELYRELYDRAIAEWPWSALLYSNRAASLLRRSCRVAVERLALLQPRRLALAPQLVSVCSVELYRELYDRAIAEWPWSALLYSNRAASLLRRSCRVAVERLALLQPRRLALAPQLVSVYSLELYRELYDRAIAEWPWSALLYSNRAASLLRRSWAGDHYAAVRDCYSAVKLDPNHAKSYFRLAKAFMELRKPRESQECLNYFKDRFPRFAESHAVFLLQKDINMALEMLETKSDEASEEEGQSGSDLERQLRSSALDYKCRFVGHCNTTTDIKEANFLGPEANYVAAGSDDGSIFIWCRKTGNIIRCLRGDDSIVNCVQLHPSMFLLATSGIESVVRLWSPRPEDGVRELREVNEPNTAAAANQKRMRSDPFESMMLNISFSSGAERDINSPACRSTCVHLHNRTHYILHTATCTRPPAAPRA